MPFQSEKQRRFLHANHPEIAKRWEREYATGGISNHFRRRVGLKKGSDGPGPGGQGARGQATQNPGRGGRNEPPGRGDRGMTYTAPTPTYQNVHQTGAISQTPGQTITTTGDGKTGDRHPPIRPKKTYGPYTPKNKYLPHYPALSKWQKEKVKDIITRAKKGTHGGYGPYTDKYTKLQHQPSLSKWQKKELKDWETLVKKGAHGGYGPYTNPWEPVDLGLVEELSTKDYTSSGPSMDEMGQWYDAGGNPIDDPNINPELAGMIKPIGGLQISDYEKALRTKTDAELKQWNDDMINSTGSGDAAAEAILEERSMANDPTNIAKEKIETLGESYWETHRGIGTKKEKERATAFMEDKLTPYKHKGQDLGITSLQEGKGLSKKETRDAIVRDYFENPDVYKEKYGITKIDKLEEIIKKGYDVAQLQGQTSFTAAKGGVARKNYFHGGILDINESEEIISDDGNDIELTDYNAAFDEPTGVKSLFQAKDGGRIGYAEGWSPGVAAEERESRQEAREAMRGPIGGPTTETKTVPSGINIHQDTGEEEEAYEIVEGQKVPLSLRGVKGIDPREDPGREDLLRTYTERMNDIQTEIKEKWRKKISPTLWEQYKSLPTLDFLGILTVIAKDMYDVHQIKKDMATLKELGLDKGHPSGTDTAYSQLQDYLAKRKLRKKDDDTGGPDGPPSILNPVTLEVDEGYAQGDYGGSLLDRDNAALYAQLSEKWRQEKLAKEQEYRDYGLLPDNPIVMEANSGGLANLFRVKNQ